MFSGGYYPNSHILLKMSLQFSTLLHFIFIPQKLCAESNCVSCDDDVRTHEHTKYEHANLPHIIIEYTTHMYLGLCTRRSVEYVQAFTIDAFSDICCKNDMNLHPKLLMEIVFPLNGKR